ncbi:hypothetical protein ACTJK5_10595 [Agrobacterium sp. 22094]|uniref:hypothetical protein n=1 Tax=Agrobacterium sp. 22094 TaxID=3453872 RepID=UPI003F838E9A
MSDTHTIDERIAEKIKAKAKARGLDSAQQLQKYIQERLCVRLWAHEESRTLTLKGGCCYHFAPEFLDLNRATADIDVHTYERIGHEEVLDPGVCECKAVGLGALPAPQPCHRHAAGLRSRR